tara:strand:- start:17 stop:760 length:744 start_codon:yes stop_codon:yes gene_type:complete
MCTSIILFRKNNKWPFILASNRDEKFSRKSKFPGKYWKNQSYVLGGYDQEAGGTWCAINNKGVIGCIHNRNFEQKVFKPSKSRGEIILKILEGRNSFESLDIIKKLDVTPFNGFNLIIADTNKAYLIKYSNFEEKIIINNIDEGISIITDQDMNDMKNKKIRYYYLKFTSVDYPNPDINNWSNWENLLSSTNIENQKKQNESICFNIDNYFGTVSSTIIALSNNDKYIYRYTEGPPNKNIYKECKLL